MSENRKHNIENHVSSQHSEGYEEQNLDGISNENEHIAMDPDVHNAIDTQTNEQSNGDTQLSGPFIESNQIERVDLDNAVLAGTLGGEHVYQNSNAKEDMFVDRPHELKEEMEAREKKEKFEENQAMQQHSHFNELCNEEERETLAQGVFNLHRQLKALVGKKSLPNEAKVEIKEEGVHMANISLNDMINQCLEFSKTTYEEQSKLEATIRHLHDLLSMKDQEILDLNTKFSVSLVSHDVAASVASSFDSMEKNSEVHQDKDHNIEMVMDKIIFSIATVVNQEQVFDDSVSGKIVHIENGTSLLIENYNQILSEIDQLAQSFSKVTVETREKNRAKNILVAACDELLGLKRKEEEFIEKLAQLDDENRKLVEELDKVKSLTSTLNAELESTKVELEKEKVYYANTKENLGKAVKEGKALVQQRDTLKQSLAAKSNELEACLTELQEKSAMLEAAEITKEELVQSEHLVASLKNSLEQSNTYFEQVKEILSETEPDKPELSDVQEILRWLVKDRNMLKDAYLEFQKLKDAISLLDMPEPVSSSNLDSQINWFSGFFQRARDEMNVLHEEISMIKQSSEDCIDHLSLSLLKGLQEKDYFQSELTNLRYKYEEIVQKSHQLSQQKDYIVKTLVELSGLNMEDNNIDIFSSDTFVIVNLCFQMIKEHRGLSYEMFERIRSFLYIKDIELTLYKDMLEEEILIKSEMNKLSNELKEACEEIQRFKEDKSSLQKDYEKSEEKSAVLRDKLCMAVKKGKGLVQDRENLKRFLNEKNLEIEQLKLDMQNHESVVSHYRDQINRLSQDLESIPKLKADLLSLEKERNQFEQYLLEKNSFLQRLIESIDGVVIPVDLVFGEPIQKVKWLAGCVSECLNAKLCTEKELQLVKEEADECKRILAEAQEAVKSMEQSLYSSENRIYQLVEEKRELEVAKFNAEEELHKVKEEAAEVCMSAILLKDTLLQARKDIYVLVNEKEHDQVSRDAVDTDIERVKEEATQQVSKLAEARKNIVDMESALSEIMSNVIMLTKKYKNDQVIKTYMECELKKGQDEDDHHDKKSLNNALLKAQDDISILEDANKIAKVSSLKLKLSSCLDELAGKRPSFHNESVELIGFLNDLQMLMKEDTLFPRVKQSLQKKFESLKTMDLILDNIKDQIYYMTGMETRRYLTLEEDLLVRKDFSNDLQQFDVISDNTKDNYADIDAIISLYGEIVKGFQLRNKLIVDKFDDFSDCIDEIVSLLLTKLQELKIDIETTCKYMETLKGKSSTMEILRDKQEKTIATLDNDITILLSAFSDSMRELQIEIERHVTESDSNFMGEKFNNESGVQEIRQQSNKYIDTAQKLINATGKTQTLIKQLELRRKEAVTTIENLQNKLNETRADLEMVIKERDHYQNSFVQPESDIQTQQKSCREVINDPEDYHALQEKLKEKEAEISSLYNSLSTKDQEKERFLLSTSEVRSLSDKIDKIEMPVMESGEDMEPHTSLTVKKLFHIIDFVTRLQQHVNFLSYDKEEMQLTLDNKILEAKSPKEEVNQHNRNWEDSKDGKGDESEITLSLEKILDMLGASDWNGEKISAGAKGLLTILEKHVMTILLESEKSKSRDQELSIKLLDSQKVIDKLTAKVNLLEHSIQNRTSLPEFHQQGKTFEVASSPVAAEMYEVEEESLGKKATSFVPQATQMLNMRKGSPDHLALDLDSESNSLINKSFIDDKGHQFKSLDRTGFVPKRGKLIADCLDGIWLSGGRALMIRPRARLGVMGYLLILHLWLMGTIL